MNTRKTELIERTAKVKEDLAEAAKAAGRNPEDVSLVAVSKLHPASDIRALAESGQVDFGENYVQEALNKQEVLTDLHVHWHFIGGLQSNKAKFVAGNFGLVHSVDSRKLAQALHKKALSLNVVQDILLQVNIAGETQKSGITVDLLPQLAEDVMKMENVRLVGLMTMPPFFDEPERARPVFSRLRELREALESRLGTQLPHLSMGMTGDFIPAVQEGATLVRIGTRIFGARTPRV
ncbi:YggS family pyridoxal phosphate-dependent enzyme [uncultured Pseudodesulfovibrio sp.]|uniref:YggS family pyridoxal phosphate-dependent enzyme n=1 Tax=uncultured Pseudodesulfovibrio sp. TaxID=2035858 RepID=UPI0029C86B39|nr:YggS family pyridoxal phosphate-dependent enzyme [uncultured Pseudodesulfovibrio sp.]